MDMELKTIQVNPASDLARDIAGIHDRVFLLQRNGVRYIVTRIDDDEGMAPIQVVDDDDIRQGYDPERLKAVLDEVAGTWSDVDAEELKEYLRRGREAGSKPPISA